ncbi:MAG: M1 family metallopeptidase [Solirubrobacterales bacterium]
MAGTRAAAPPLILLVAAAALTLAAPAGAAPAPGAAGLGDPFFPNAGNGGYDVSHYDLAIRYQPGEHRLRGRARINATATQDLSQFDLDYRGPKISSLVVNGARAAFDRQGQELVITPLAPIATGAGFEIKVSYRGTPHQVTDPDGSPDGWITTDDGAFVADEPQGAPTWFPCNDYPTDKASFEIRLEVPTGTEAIANGKLARRGRHGHWSTWDWVERQPMATYLATATIGDFRISHLRPAGIPAVVAIDPRQARKARPALDLMPRILGLFKRLYGPYPFGQVGAVIDQAPDVGYSLETQTRPIFDRAPDDVLLAHELSHQWFGDSVSLERWPDMWLNEGFATWSEWRWAQANGGLSTARQFAKLARMPASKADIWAPPPAAIPEPKKLFADSVYVRGAMALEALRQRIGNPAFYATLRAWVAQHSHSNAGIDQFIALAEAQSGQQLDDLFQAWLYQPGKPPTTATSGS